MSSDPNEFEKKIEQQTAATAFQLAWSVVSRVGKRAWEKVAVQRAMKKYANRYRERHGSVNILGMSKPIALHDIYTNVRVVSTEHLYQYTNLEDMEKRFLAAGRQHAAYQEASRERDGVSLANEEQYLNVLGSAGSGKSTFLRRMGQEALLVAAADGPPGSISTEYAHSKLPVLLELRRFRHDSIDLLLQITNEFATCGFPESDAFVKSALDTGGMLVLLDGLDEVSDDKLDRVIHHIADFSDKYWGNRFITSCRTAHYKNFFSRFTDVVLTDFSNEQIADFASKWFSSDRDRRSATSLKFVKRLEETQSAAALELARTPLLLAFLCMTFEHGQELPPTRATLYRRALEILLREWAAERRVHNEPVYAELHAELEVDMLSEMAESLFRDDRFFFPRQEAIDHIRGFMESELNAPRSLDAGQILNAIEVQQGLIIRRAQDAYSFSHLTIQEYLTAKKIWEDGPSAWTAALNDHLFKERWSVVFILLAGMGKADGLLKLMAERAQAELWRIAEDSDAVKALLSWIDAHAVKPSTDRVSIEQAAVARIVMCSLVMSVVSAPELVAELDRTPPVEMTSAKHAAVNLAAEFERRMKLGQDRDLERYGPRGDLPQYAPDEALALTRKLIQKSFDLSLVDTAKRGQLEEALEHLNDGRSRNMRSSEYGMAATKSLRIPDKMLNVSFHGETLDRYFRAWLVVLKSRHAAYRTTSAVWDEVCQSLLSIEGAPSYELGGGEII